MNLVNLYYIVPVIVGVVVAVISGFFKEPSGKRGLIALSAVLAGFIICWCIIPEDTKVDPSSTPTPMPTPTPTLSLSAFHGNLSDYRNVAFSNATASSVFSEQSGFRYEPTNAIRDDRVPWVEGAKGDGSGEYLVLSFYSPETIDVLGLRLGFIDYYSDNNRPRALRFDFSDGSTVEYKKFEDKDEMQYVKLSHPVTTEYIRITILSVYRGSKFDDTCITLVQAFEAK